MILYHKPKINKSQKLQTDEARKSLYMLSKMAYVPSKSCPVRKCFFVDDTLLKSRVGLKEKRGVLHIFSLLHSLCDVFWQKRRHYRNHLTEKEILLRTQLSLMSVGVL